MEGKSENERSQDRPSQTMFSSPRDMLRRCNGEVVDGTHGYKKKGRGAARARAETLGLRPRERRPVVPDDIEGDRPDAEDANREDQTHSDGKELHRVLKVRVPMEGEGGPGP